MNSPLTIADLARHLHISQSTVSKALNGRKDISVSLREKVLQAAEALGYSPNPQARKLAMKSSGTLGVFLLNRYDRPVETYFGYQFLGGILKEAQEQEKDLLIFSECRDLTRQGYLGYCRRKGAEGAIFIGLGQEDSQMGDLGHSDFPVVTIDTPIPDNPRGFISSDNEAGIQALTEHLFSRGLTDCGYLGIRGQGYVAQSRLQGFHHALKSLGNKPASILEAPLSLEGGRLAALEILSRKSRPQALVCASDLQALGVLQAASELGLRVPGDLAVTGYDNIQASAFCHPHLTTYAQDILEMGRLAVRTLLNPAKQTVPHLVPGRLVLRTSA